MTNERLDQIQTILKETGVSGWLLYNFRDSNVIASRILGLPEGVHQTRRWALLLPAEGEPVGLVHRIEPHLKEGMPGIVIPYSSQVEFESALETMLDGHERVAMEYSPGNRIPVVARVDAGTIELVRGFGTEVVSSAELIARLESRLDPDQIESAVRAGKACRATMMSAFDFIASALASGEEVNEHDVVLHILSGLESHGLETDHDPNCSVDDNSANPHYQPTESKNRIIRKGSFVLIDLWGREKGGRGVFGDLTWVGYCGEEVPEHYDRIFQIVRKSRDAALELVRSRCATGEQVTGAELDDAARNVINEAGFGDQFIHRTGHSITADLHGAGTNLDNFETCDDRPILRSTSFSIEPGIYLPGEFGVRLELDVVIDGQGIVHVPSEPLQDQITTIV